MIVEISIFNRRYLNNIQDKERRLTATEERLALVKAKIKLSQDNLPKISDNAIWLELYLELEQLQREELRLINQKNFLWAEIKTILYETERKPDCEVVQIIHTGKTA